MLLTMFNGVKFESAPDALKPYAKCSCQPTACGFEGSRSIPPPCRAQTCTMNPSSPECELTGRLPAGEGTTAEDGRPILDSSAGASD
jgi:hypothetical protein